MTMIDVDDIKKKKLANGGVDFTCSSPPHFILCCFTPINKSQNSRYRVHQEFLCPEDNSRVRLKGGQDVGNTKLQQYGVQSWIGHSKIHMDFVQWSKLHLNFNKEWNICCHLQKISPEKQSSGAHFLYLAFTLFTLVLSVAGTFGAFH